MVVKRKKKKVKKNEKKKSKIEIWLLFSLVALLVIGVVAAFFINNNNINKVASEETLAKCLTAKGVVMYGSKYCGWCNKQKELFGEAFQYINYVECTTSTLCREKGVSGYPTWEISKKLSPGYKSLEKLARLAGCRYS